MNSRITNIEVQQFKEKKEQGEGIRNLVGVHGVSVFFSLKLGHLATRNLLETLKFLYD
jgi:hypothetical protein